MTYMTDENKMPYICVLELLRYRGWNNVAKFFVRVFLLTKWETAFSNTHSLQLK